MVLVVQFYFFLYQRKLGLVVLHLVVVDDH